MIFQIIGVIGLVIIIIGLLLIKRKFRKMQYILFILGGIGLLIYSISIRDIIFAILQAAFTLASIYGLIKIKKQK